MKSSSFILLFLFFIVPAYSQQAPQPYGPLPNQVQLKWHEIEMYCLVHYGVNTYLDHEWGYGDEDPQLINPTKFDARQIVGAAKAGGFKGVIVVAKHHDGLCLWPTASTSHNISHSKWRAGKGDLVKDYQMACKQLGVNFGIYCSPWDRNNADYGKAAYLDTFRAQLNELFSNYGALFMTWFDGANGGNGYYGGARENRNIDRTSYYDWNVNWAITRKLQPTAAIFGDLGLDVRWIGNEEGIAGETCWATYTPLAPDPSKEPANGYAQTDRATEGTRNGKFWMPAECDVPLRPGWFYHDSQDTQVRTPSELLDIYYASVGRGAGLDLGLAPNKEGLLDQADVASLKTFGELLKQTFAQNLALGARLTASNVRGNNSARFGPRFLLDNNRYTYWATDDKVKKPSLTLVLPVGKAFNVIRLRENIKLGQRIGSVAIDVMQDGKWKEIATATSIGPNRLIRLGRLVSARQIRLRVTSSPVCIALSDFGLYREPLHLKAPRIKREKDGTIQISAPDENVSLRYTLDGSLPGRDSRLYTSGFSLPQGGMVTARSFDLKETPGDASMHIFGISKKEWRVLSAVAQSTANNAIDEDEASNWTSVDQSAPFPQDIVIDMNQPETIQAFTYLPRQDKKYEGLINQYVYYTSDNGMDWKMAREGEFSNMEANPVQQMVFLKNPVKARYFKFSAVHTNHGKGISVAELGVVTRYK